MENPHPKALITSNTHLTDTDGKSIRVLNLAELLSKAGFKVTLLVSQSSSIKAKKFSVIETNSRLKNTLKDNYLGKLVHFCWQFIALMSFYAKLLVYGASYDVILSTLVGPETDSLLACFVSKIRRIPFIYDYDDPSPEIRLIFYGRGRKDMRFKLSVFTRNLLVNNASLILTSSDSTRQQLFEVSKKRKKVVVWYNLPKFDQVHLHENKEQLQKKLGLSSKSMIFSYIGNIPNWFVETMKSMLVHCAKNLKHDENVRFLIIGGGPWEDYYRKSFQKLGFNDRIVITGRKDRQSALEYFTASDVSLIPIELNCATIHIVPTKLFESMALGIPVLCAPSPSLVQILEDDGVYFDGSSRNLLEKVRWCLVNKEKLAEISSRLRLKFLNEYNLENRQRSLMKVLKEISA